MRSYFSAVAVAVLLLGLVVLYVLEFRYFNLLLDARTLVLRSLGVGAVAGMVAGYFSGRRYANPLERIQIIIFITVLTTLFTPLFGSLSNRWLGRQPLRLEPVEFVEEQPNYSDRFGLIEGERPEPNGFLLFFYYEGRLFRIKYETSLFAGKHRGERIDLPMRKGFWGYYLVVPQEIGERPQLS